MEQVFSYNLRPQCVTLLVPYQGRYYACPYLKLGLQIEINIATAFVRMNVSWLNNAAFQSDLLFVVPTFGSVTDVKVSVGERKLITRIVPMDVAVSLAEEGHKNAETKSRQGTNNNGDNSSSSASHDSKQGRLPAMNYQEYIPNLFRLPIKDVKPGETVSIECLIIQPLDFIGDRYHFTHNLTFDHVLIYEKLRIEDVLSITCAINSVNEETDFFCSTHEIKVTEEIPGQRVVFDVINWREFPRTNDQRYPSQVFEESVFADINALASCDFHVSYKFTRGDTKIALVQQPFSDELKEEFGEGGHFFISITPPQKPDPVLFRHHTIFLLDISGSMTGEPFAEASEALAIALSELQAQDFFNIIAFDHRQTLYSPDLVPATDNNVMDAQMWIQNCIRPNRGGTNIMKPLCMALNILEDETIEIPAENGSSASKGVSPGVVPSQRTTLPSTSGINVNGESKNGLNNVNNATGASRERIDHPMIILITDGCVANERQICNLEPILNSRIKTRILTLGIGTYCNWYFLRMLAQLSRGFSEFIPYQETIHEQTSYLVRRAAVPLLTDISFELEREGGGGDDNKLEYYPQPVPDLYLHSPVVVSGEYRGTFPGKIRVKGITSRGTVWTQVVTAQSTNVIPIARSFAHLRLNLLTARSWLSDDPKLKKKIIDLSVRAQVPTAYTSMVAVEVDDEKAANDARSVQALAVAGASGAIIIGAGLFTFGNLDASIGNLNVFAGLDGELIGCCDCMGDCSFDCLGDICFCFC